MGGLRVAIRCDFISGGNVGGVEQFVVGLIRSLAEYGDGDVEYVLVTNPRDPDWPREYADETMEVVSRPWRSRLERVRSSLEPLERIASPIIGRLVAGGGPPTVGDESEFYQELDVDLVHHPTQNFVETGLPSVYNPWDLQHLRYPEFFSEEQIEWRETVYRAGCERASAVEVPTKAVKENVEAEYDIDPEKVHVIFPGPPAGTHSDPTGDQVAAVRDEYDLPRDFLFYPATTWPHKNHQRLIEAVSHLKNEHGQDVSLVCVGKQTDHWDQVEGMLAETGVGDRVHFPGYVDNDRIGAFYQEAAVTVFPSLYEGLGMPVLESWQYDTPVCCSDIAPLSDITGPAARRFDPESPPAIVDAVEAVLSDEELRADLIAAGQDRLAEFSWERTVRRHESLYRTVGA